MRVQDRAQVGRRAFVKLLVLTSEPLDAGRLRQALPGDLDPTQAEVMVVAPALQDSAIRFWFSDADDAIAHANEVLDSAVSNLERGGVSAIGGETGDSDPYQAIQDALQRFPADQILLFTHRGEDQRYREDIDLDEVRERFGVPVERVAL